MRLFPRPLIDMQGHQFSYFQAPEHDPKQLGDWFICPFAQNDHAHGYSS
jgi:hypothetical protein